MIARPTAGVRALAATVLLLALLRLAGCVPIQEEDDDLMIPPLVAASPTPVPGPTVPAITDIAIVDMHESPGSDPSLIRVGGTIVNQSKEEVAHVTVRVEARDALGRALTRVTVPALAEPIPAGGTSSFEASMPKSATIHDYHAEVVSK